MLVGTKKNHHNDNARLPLPRIDSKMSIDRKFFANYMDVSSKFYCYLLFTNCSRKQRNLHPSSRQTDERHRTKWNCHLGWKLPVALWNKWHENFITTVSRTICLWKVSHVSIFIERILNSMFCFHSLNYWWH